MRCIEFILFSYIGVSFVFSSENDIICKKLDACKCKFDNGLGINLSEVEFVNYTSSDGKTTYFFHPCSDVPIGNITTSASDECIPGAALCRFDQNVKSYLKLGSSTNATYLSDGYNYPFILRYVVGNITSDIYLKCSAETSSVLNGTQINSTYHKLTLLSSSACLRKIDGIPIQPTQPTPSTTTESPAAPSGGLSTGSVLVILFFSLLALYFGGGILALKFLRGASGKEMIPNYDFWVDLPFLCRDGILFVLYGCKVPPSYERI